MAATSAVTDAYEAVESSYFDTRVGGLVMAYDPNTGFDVRKIAPFLPAEHLSARLKALKAVSAYAKGLAEIMGDEKLKEFDEETQALGEALKAFSKGDAAKALSGLKDVSDSDLAVLATAVNVIGRWFIEYRREKAVKAIVADMDPHVAKICKLLQRDIGGPKAGLRGQLSNQYEKLLIDRDAFIAKNHKQFSPAELREELTKLADLARQRPKADAALEAAGRSLGKLAEAHAKLGTAFDKNAPNLESLVRQLAAEAKRAKEFYDQLTK